MLKKYFYPENWLVSSWKASSMFFQSKFACDTSELYVKVVQAGRQSHDVEASDTILTTNKF